jgi:membrane-associated protein
MEFFPHLYQLLRNLGENWAWTSMIDCVGGTVPLYAVLFGIVFAETGLVVTPFLPGDSLLFAIGAVGARGVGIDVWVIGPLLVCAALIGDNLNYWLGRSIGKRVMKREKTFLINKKHLIRAHEFYETYGPKTVILARFVPIVRTFSPFVAGIASMTYTKFLLYSVIGAIAWVVICMGAGFMFGQTEFVKKHFELVIVAIVVISVLPMAVEYLKARRHKKPESIPAISSNSLEKP